MEGSEVLLTQDIFRLTPYTCKANVVIGLMHKHENPVNPIGMSARGPAAARITKRIAAICFKRLANRHGVLPPAGVAQYCLSTEAGFPHAAGVREETRPRVQRTNFIEGPSGRSFARAGDRSGSGG